MAVALEMPTVACGVLFGLLSGGGGRCLRGTSSSLYGALAMRRAAGKEAIDEAQGNGSIHTIFASLLRAAAGLCC
jgi:hypothetical protein